MAHKPRVLLLTPPPIDEYQQVLADQARGFTPVRRLAENTGAYAEACRDVGAQLGIPVVDIWTAFLRQAGWRSKQQFLPGSREIPPNKVFQSFFTDGKCSRPKRNLGVRRLTSTRAAFNPIWLQNRLRRSH